MKKTLSLALVMIMAITGVFAKENQTATNKTVKGKNVSITYSQPSSHENGKVAFGSTVLTLTKDCLIGGNKRSLKAGTYDVKINAAGGEWVFMLSKPGSANEVVLSTWALVKHTATSTATLDITSNSDGLLMEVDNISVQLPITFAN